MQQSFFVRVAEGQCKPSKISGANLPNRSLIYCVALVVSGCGARRCDARFSAPPSRISQTTVAGGAAPLFGSVSNRRTLQPLNGASVTLLDSARREVTGALTRDSGYFEIAAAKPGRYIVLIRSIGYERTTTEVTIHAARSTRLIAEIGASPLMMSPNICDCIREKRDICI